MSEKVRKHIIFYGRVQGVGFRYYSVYNSFIRIILILYNANSILINYEHGCEKFNTKKAFVVFLLFTLDFVTVSFCK